MAQSGIMTTFKVTLIVMLFYSFSITVIAEFIPESGRAYVTSFSEGTTTVDEFSDYSQDVQEQLTQQTNIPVLDVGSLVFYSGNILLNLLINFVYAIPQMIGFLIHGLTLMLNLDKMIVYYIELFSAVVVSILYIVGLVQLITGVRSGRIV